MKVLASSRDREPRCVFAKDFWGNYKGIQIDFADYEWDRIKGITLLDEEQYNNWAAKAGWGLSLGLLTGGVGLIAGALVAGNRKDRIVKFDLPHNLWVIAVVKRKDFRLCPKRIQSRILGY
ncbi:MAG: hypothetical protein Hens2KO_05620 [Henriciella sp.]